jgi:hypothetical protein
MSNGEYDLNHQLTRANDSRISQDQLTWVIFSIFAGANALLVGNLYQFSGNCVYILKFIPIIPRFGLFLSLIWLFALMRVVPYYLKYEDLVMKLETQI